MKTRKTTLQLCLLAAVMALPLVSHADNGLDAYGVQSQESSARNGADAGPGADVRSGHGGPDGERGMRGPPSPGRPGVSGDFGGPGGRGGMASHGGPGEMGPWGLGLGSGPGSGPRRMPFGQPPFMHGLALSEAQQDKVFAILHAQAPYLREQGKAFHKAQEALHALGSADKYDDAKAASLSQAAAQAMSNLELQRVRTGQKLLAVLTAEQRKQLDQRKPPHPQPQ
ncbi:periplasmic heavy metal sensor [Pseudoduganella sp. LjRoot289]|uniref:Spy/CpxP family protein refolding chaperone n=1 Tax=Pseudoduganella sp. LjRoot289 TaxID=3342314 RepID=UPI003ECDF5DA